MNDHVNGWLAAYFDGELTEARARIVRSHLEECEACREELASLGRLREFLGAHPKAAGLRPARRFASQVAMRLDRRQSPPTWRRALEVAWGSIPAFLLVTWAFIQALFILTSLGGAAQDLGFWSGVVSIIDRPTPSGALLWNLVSSALIGTLLLSWLASWWIRRGQGKAQLATE